jgi:hypothetical protein
VFSPVNVGLVANDGTGDLNRDAFIKINSNFREVYGGAYPIPLIAGQWYAAQPFSSRVAGGATTSDTVRMQPGLVRERCTINQLQARVVTPVASSTFDLAMYAANPATGLPTGTALASVAGLSGATAALLQGTLASAITVDPGFYYFAVSASANIAFTAYGVGNTFFSGIVGFADGNHVNGGNAGISVQWLGYSAPYGTFPDVTALTPSFNATATFAAIDYRISAVG